MRIQLILYFDWIGMPAVKRRPNSRRAERAALRASSPHHCGWLPQPDFTGASASKQMLRTLVSLSQFSLYFLRSFRVSEPARLSLLAVVQQSSVRLSGR